MTKINFPKILAFDILVKIRKEIISYILIFLVCWIIIFFSFPKISPYLLSPYFDILGNRPLVFTSLEEAFFTILKASFYLSFGLTLPVLLIQLWKAISGEFYESEKIFLKKLIFISILFILLGILAGYFFIIPLILKVFLYFGRSFICDLKISLFLLFILKTILFSILFFQIPLFFALLIREGIITDKLYKKKRLYFFALFYIIAIIFSPTDFIIQILLTLIFFLFFKSAFIIAKILK